MLPDIHYGTADSRLPDWREMTDKNDADDDEELAKTPQDVIELLGFDPRNEEEGS